MSQVRKIIKHRSLMQTEKSQPSGQRLMLETWWTSMPALSIYPPVAISGSASETDVRLYFFSPLFQRGTTFVTSCLLPWTWKYFSKWGLPLTYCTQKHKNYTQFWIFWVQSVKRKQQILSFKSWFRFKRWKWQSCIPWQGIPRCITI